MRTLRPVLVLMSIVFVYPRVPRSAAQVVSGTRPSETLDSSGSKYSLNGTWQFALGRGEQQTSELNDFWKPSFHGTRFQPIAVPGNWSMFGFEVPRYGRLPDADVSEGFYLHRFRVPMSMQHRRVLLHFGGVWDSAEVWLNGKLPGRHDSGFTSFSFDASDGLLFDQENVLAIRVRQQTRDSQLDINDDWSLPGIYRDVSLEAMPSDRWIDRVGVQTVLNHQFRDADLKVRILVGEGRSRDVAASPYKLVLTLFDATEHVVNATRLAVPTHTRTDRVSDIGLHVSNPLLWTAETPKLYSLRVDLPEGDTVTHRRTRMIGFREGSTVGGVLRVNGQTIKLRGVDRHDESAVNGRATTPIDWERDLSMMKDANINFVRVSHYPPAEGFLDLCDRIGMYVEDEVPMGYGGDKANDHFVRPHVHQRYLPFVGMALHPPVSLSHARWLGLGPLDNFPNEKAAANFGVWSLERKDTNGENIKASRWTELTGADGNGLRIKGSPYLRFAQNEFTALATVAGWSPQGAPT